MGPPPTIATVAPFLWSACLFALAIYPMLLVYREWKKQGGPHHYKAPLPLESMSAR